MAGTSFPPRCPTVRFKNTNMCTDDVRRSGRATKGKDTRERDIDDVAAKKGKKGKGSKAKVVEEVEEEEQDEADSVRCICGEYEPEEEYERGMICCDNCDKWEHNDCMDLPEDFEADEWYCEICRPEDHQELLAAVERGEKPWIPRIRRAAPGKKKAGKKGRKSAGDEIKDSKPSTPSAGQKRKAEDSPAVSETKASTTVPEHGSIC